MFNPNSAIDRIKNSLSYKLGFAILEHKKQHGGGYITLSYKLYKINQQHKKEQKLYKQTIKIFPQLTYLKVESCRDYNESIKYKYHFSYMLGEALIKAHKTWHKGGYFKLPSLLKEKYKLYKNIQNIINILPQNLHYHFYNSTIKNHKINIQDLIDILKQHKDYKPILENIFHNFDFFIKHFDLIRIWLSSKDFKEKYKQENHPYPSLLDPKKLNDQNEKINYKNIPAELAWEMNLPLPDNYKFVFLLIHGAGTTTMTRYLRICDINLNRHWGDPIFQYMDSYRLLMKCLGCYNAIILAGQVQQRHKNMVLKFYYLIQKIVPAICVVRDPISTLRPIVNHYGNLKHPKEQIRSDIDVYSNLNEIFDIKVPYAYPDIKGNPTLNTVKEYAYDKYGDFFILNLKINVIKNINKIFYISMDDILPGRSYKTLCDLSEKLGFKFPNDNELFYQKTNSSDYHVDLLFFPKRIHIRQGNSNIVLEITKQKKYSDEYIDCNNLFTISDFLLNEICLIVYAKRIDYDSLKHIIRDSFIVGFFLEYFDRLESFYLNERKKLINEKDMLMFMRKDKKIVLQYKEKFDREFAHLKQCRPDIVASWKYYQEFERMCKELDGN
ncbi:DUF2972 domain-containing protein [Campylobacter sp. CNRCH_2013_0671h]|uniref:DUF2972 domain-containing protein n=1 Tax=Campylobacter sp. CNRCH_2013_0671h TaxID=2911599 RepID=UPI0021E6BD03|nr:DUF2972 domain-containing protein [Campylobacter sp. CNRCH_2013_0671h]MCV3549391.1 DUF2972 domain-containing protein [Campylobacter sp. CNRCH_2013_0671h]